MAKTVTFEDPHGIGEPITLEKAVIPADLPDADIRRDHIPEPDPYYVDLGMLYRLAALEQVRERRFEGIPLHLALRGHMGTGKDHDLEQFAALLGFPYYRIPLTGEVRDITLIGSVKLHGDGMGGTESRWQDGDITRALRGPALVNLSELNAAGAETLFALHGLLDRHQALETKRGAVPNDFKGEAQADGTHQTQATVQSQSRRRTRQVLVAAVHLLDSLQPEPVAQPVQQAAQGFDLHPPHAAVFQHFDHRIRGTGDPGCHFGIEFVHSAFGQFGEILIDKLLDIVGRRGQVLARGAQAFVAGFLLFDFSFNLFGMLFVPGHCMLPVSWKVYYRKAYGCGRRAAAGSAPPSRDPRAWP